MNMGPMRGSVDDSGASWNPGRGLGVSGSDGSFEESGYWGVGRGAGAKVFVEDERPYTDTIIGLHISKRGVRLAFQGPRVAALIVVLGIVVLLSSPKVVDVLTALLHSIAGH